ncbi:MAG: LicD family protein, partial [Clostridia bacterium]|nr:LicD family protein [Clostridia bacterium]
MDNLRKLQLIEVEILEEIDKVCRDEGIDYSLYAGSLLGAVRHKGFIPWDDDLDICMTRSNYNKFIQAWESGEHKGYFLQNKEKETTFTQSFTKIRKDHTAFIQGEFECGIYHTGIFVDIFPMDRIPNGRLKKISFKLKCLLYQLYTREFLPEKSNFLVKCIAFFVLSLTPKKIRQKKR